MKETALLPLRYLLTVILLVALLGGIDVLHAVGQYELSDSNVLPAILADALFAAVPISCIAATAITLFTILLNPAHRFIKLIGVFISTSAVLIVGVGATTILASETALETAPLPKIETNRLYRTAEETVYAETRQGVRLNNIVTHVRSREPGFELTASAVVDAQTRAIRVPESDLTLPLSNMRLTTPGIVRPPAGIDGVLADARRMAVTLAVAALPSANASNALPTTRAILPSPNAAPGERTREPGAGAAGEFAAAPADGPAVAPLVTLCTALAFAMTAMWSVVRLTRWPLFNALFAAGAIRMLLLLVRAAGDPSLVTTVYGYIGDRLDGYLLAAALAAVGLILLTLRLFLPSFAAWRREMAHG